MYHWNFHHSSTTQSIDLNKNHIAKLTEARISYYQKSLVIEDQGNFVAENISSDLSEDHGFTVSFSVRQTGNYRSTLSYWLFTLARKFKDEQQASGRSVTMTEEFLYSGCDETGQAITVVIIYHGSIR